MNMAKGWLPPPAAAAHPARAPPRWPGWPARARPTSPGNTSAWTAATPSPSSAPHHRNHYRDGADRMGLPKQGAAAGGPVSLTASATVAHRPLGGRGARLRDGLLHDWQARNRDVSLPLALRHLRT